MIEIGSLTVLFQLGVDTSRLFIGNKCVAVFTRAPAGENDHWWWYDDDKIVDTGSNDWVQSVNFWMSKKGYQ